MGHLSRDLGEVKEEVCVKDNRGLRFEGTQSGTAASVQDQLTNSLHHRFILPTGHTHIFFLPPHHKLWLHMGKPSLPQECNKPQHMPRTLSLDSHTEFPPMVHCGQASRRKVDCHSLSHLDRRDFSAMARALVPLSLDRHPTATRCKVAVLQHHQDYIQEIIHSQIPLDLTVHSRTIHLIPVLARVSTHSITTAHHIQLII
uniref:Uncharacterized protein n=1 Tax=Castor canadensis TaxID=51338 RepID=A0A8C0WW48_CASCN